MTEHVMDLRGGIWEAGGVGMGEREEGGGGTTGGEKVHPTFKRWARHLHEDQYDELYAPLLPYIEHVQH
jgi:hypothetical protein